MKLTDLPLHALVKQPPAPAVSAPPLSACGGWRSRIAVRQDQLMAADELVRRRYIWRGYRSPALEVQGAGEAGPRITLLAEHGGKLAGTLTVRPDSPQGLLADQTFPEETGRMRAHGSRLGELVKLAVEDGADLRQALDALVQSAYVITRVVHALTDVLIEVNPRHVRFYRRVFGFALAAAERTCERAGAPAVLLRLDLEQFSRRLQLAA